MSTNCSNLVPSGGGIELLYEDTLGSAASDNRFVIRATSFSEMIDKYSVIIVCVSFMTQYEQSFSVKGMLDEALSKAQSGNYAFSVFRFINTGVSGSICSPGYLSGIDYECVVFIVTSVSSEKTLKIYGIK